MEYSRLCFMLLSLSGTGLSGYFVVVTPSPTAEVVSGQNLSITCQWSADYTGPNAAVNYRLNNGTTTIGTVLINFGTACPSTPPYTFTCNRDTKTLAIQIPANSYRHGDRWTCEGRKDNSDGTTPPQTDTTTVDVKDVTGLSMVVSPSPTANVVSDQNLNITCQWPADYTGPNAAVNYRLNDGEGIIGGVLINFGTSCKDISNTPPYILICNRDTRTLGIQIPATSYSHGDRWTCEGRNNSFDSTSQPQTNTTTVYVKVPVTSVTINPSTSVTVDAGTSTTLTCATQPHTRPTASVTWYRVVSGQPQHITTNISVSHDTQNSAQTTTSILSYVPSKEDNGRPVYCVSDGGWTGIADTTLESGRVSLNVRYPPDTDPIVSGYDGSTKYTGDSVTLSCTVVGGNPAASLSLSCPDGTTSTSGNLTVTLSNTFHGSTCSCVGTHVVGGYRRAVDTPTFIVNIPVTSVTITPSATVTVDVGTSTTMTCTTQPHSRPTASVTWYRLVSGQPQHITANISVSYDTQNSAQTTTSVLSYVPSNEDNGRTVYCVSDGGWTGSTDTTLESGRVSLNVRYRPAISIAPQDNPYVITEGQTGISLVCNVTSANPGATSIVWTREATEVSNTGVYNLATITKGHSGEYTCSATNDVGTTSESITLVVTSSPAEPNIVGITNVSSSSLTVKWSPNDESSEPSTFNVTHRCKRCEVPDTTSIVRIPNKGVYSTTFNNLSPETLYYVNITAINQVGSSNPLDLIVSTQPEETCFSSLKGSSSSSTALIVVGAILIFISFTVLGFSIFLYRKSRLPSRPVDQQEETPKSVVFSSVLRSEKESDMMPAEENKSHYQELDPSDIQPPSTYECLSRDDDAAIMKYERDNYESLQEDSVKRDYEQLHVDDESKHYLNT